MSLARPIAELLPHQGPALLIAELLELDPDTIRCRATVPTTSPFIADDQVPAFLGIEMGAQAAALHDIALAGADAPDKHGYIVAVRRAVMHVPRIDVSQRIVVEARREASAAPLFNYAIAVRAAEVLVMEASISTYVA